MEKGNEVRKMGVMNRVFGYLGLSEEKIIEREVETEEEIEESYYRGKPKTNNIVSLQQARQAQASKVILSEPLSYNEVQEIADHLRAKKTVIMNLHRVKTEQAKRIIDFLSGTVYALNGGIQKLGNSIFICTPENVDVQGTISDWIEDEQR